MVDILSVEDHLNYNICRNKFYPSFNFFSAPLTAGRTCNLEPFHSGDTACTVVSALDAPMKCVAVEMSLGFVFLLSLRQIFKGILVSPCLTRRTVEV